VSEASGVYHAAAAALAKDLLKPNTTKSDFATAKDALFPAEDHLSVLQHHDGITGTHAAFVGLDYLAGLNKKMQPTRDAYTGTIYARLHNELGLKLGDGAAELKMCATKKEITEVEVGCKPLALQLG
jgi:hypothetical protein